MTELGDLCAAHHHRHGLSYSASPPWPIPPSKGLLLEPVKPVSGLGCTEKVPEGMKHLESYQLSGEINTKQRAGMALAGVSVFVCGLGAEGLTVPH